MASLSQALRLGDLPPPHRTFQGHATHIIEWSMMLRPNDSWGVGRIRARYLTARLPNPPVRPVRETFASYGSRARDITGKVHFASSTEHSPWTALRVRWVPLYCFPTLSLRSFAMCVALLGRHRARYLTARLPMPPVRPVRETFTSYGSRERGVYRKLPFRHLHGTFPVVSLRVRWVPLYHFPTLSLRAFAMCAVFPCSD